MIKPAWPPLSTKSTSSARFSPHSASTVGCENSLLTDLFLDNLDRFARGRPLRNRYEPERGY